MKFLSLLLQIACLGAVVYAQIEPLPEILRPDSVWEVEASRVGGKVFKMLPPETLYKNSPDESRNDRDFPFGIRGGGAFYSFVNDSHSFNRAPDVSLYGDRLASGPQTSLVLVRDLGKLDLADLQVDSDEIRKVLQYVPPKYFREFADERLRLKREYNRDMESGGSLYLRFQVGVTYLFRSIILDKSDILVAFQVVETDINGVVTIVWKELKRFPFPHTIYMPDDELQFLVNAIIVEDQLKCNKVVAKSNRLYFTSDPAVPRYDNSNCQLDRSLGRRKVRYNGFGSSIPK